MSAITTHVLDTAGGRPAAGVPVTLERRKDAGDWETLGSGHTDDDGRLKTLLPPERRPDPGVYRLTFDTDAYFAASKTESFYPAAQISFYVRDAGQHYHVPLLLSPFGFTTYRGS